MNKTKIITITTILTIILSLSVFAYLTPLQYHPPEQMIKGIFGDDYYYFNNTLYVNVTNENVGIGTTTPGTKLEVNGSLNITGASSKVHTPEICLNSVCRTSWPTGAGVSDAAGWVNTTTETTTLLNVGVGTRAPGAKLDVNGSAVVGTSGEFISLTRFGSGPQMYFGTTPLGPEYLIIGAYLGTNNINTTNRNFRLYSNADTTGVNYDSTNGNVGIGTVSPNQKLQVIGNVNVSGVVFTSNISSNTSLQLQTGGASRIFIDGTTGDVGIGTTAGLAKLSVNGGAHIGGDSDPGDNNLLVDGSISGNSLSSTTSVSAASVSATGAISGASVSTTGNVVVGADVRMGWDLVTSATPATGQDEQTDTATCVSGRVIGGGCTETGAIGGNTRYLTSNYPSAATVWTCISDDGGNSIDAQLTAYAICANILP